MAEQNLDHLGIDVLLEQVGGEAVPQGVELYTLVDLGPLSCGMAGAVELACAQWVQPVLSRKTANLVAAPASTRPAVDRADAGTA
jgi:hypothetical protein